MYIRLLSLLVIVGIVCVISEMPTFPIDELCDHYREKCETKLKKPNCKKRALECREYANNGMTVTWNFCMFLNNDNSSTCRERSIIDYDIIKSVVMNDTFKYDFAE